jgi:hypothetical protein
MKAGMLILITCRFIIGYFIAMRETLTTIATSANAASAGG